MPCASAHSHISRQAAYCCSWVVFANDGTRKSKRRPTRAGIDAGSSGAPPAASMQAAWPLLLEPRSVLDSVRRPLTAAQRATCGCRTVTIASLMPTSAHPPSTSAAAAPDARLHDETVRQLVERARAAFMLIICAVIAFAGADLAVNRHMLGPLFAIAALQIGAAAAGIGALGGSPARARAIAVPLVVLTLVFTSGAVSDVLSNNLYATLTMSLLGALVSSALLPWGVWPQLVASTVMIGAGVTAFTAVQGS